MWAHTHLPVSIYLECIAFLSIYCLMVLSEALSTCLDSKQVPRSSGKLVLLKTILSYGVVGASGQLWKMDNSRRHSTHFSEVHWCQWPQNALLGRFLLFIIFPQFLHSCFLDLLLHKLSAPNPCLRLCFWGSWDMALSIKIMYLGLEIHKSLEIRQEPPGAAPLVSVNRVVL